MAEGHRQQMGRKLPKNVLQKIEADVRRYRTMRLATVRKRQEQQAARAIRDPLKEKRDLALYTEAGIAKIMQRLVAGESPHTIAKELGCTRKHILRTAWEMVVLRCPHHRRNDELWKDHGSVRFAKYVEPFRLALTREPSEYERRRWAEHAKRQSRRAAAHRGPSPGANITKAGK